MRQALLLLILAITSLSNAAEESTPPWLQPDALKAAVAIGLSHEQLPQFHGALTDLINNQIAATNKLLRRNNVEDLERKIKTATNRQFTKMDKNMGGFLTDEQYPRYEVYRSILKSHLRDGAMGRGSSSEDSMNNAGSAINSNNNHH